MAANVAGRNGFSMPRAASASASSAVASAASAQIPTVGGATRVISA